MLPRGAPLLAGFLLALALAGCSDGGRDGEPLPGADEGMLRGVVVTGAIVPIANASVVVTPGDIGATTDALGNFEVGPLATGAYRVEATAPGYAMGFVVVDVGPTDLQVVSVVLEAVSTDVPYYELEHFEAYIECSYAQNFGGVVGGDFSCFGVTDLVLGVKVDNDVNAFPMHVNGGGFKGLLFEMVWDPQSTMPNYAGFIRSAVPVGEAGGLGLEHQYWVDSGPSPLQAWVYQGIENDGAYDGDVFHPDASVAADYEVLIGGVTSGDQPAEVAFALQQTLDVFVTKFYNALGDPSYTVLDGA